MKPQALLIILAVVAVLATQTLSASPSECSFFLHVKTTQIILRVQVTAVWCFWD
jgi:hypothetical protein